MKVSYLSFIVCFWLVSAGCTGINYLYMVGITPNTNPTKDYANLFYLYAKGGAIIHSGTVPGSIGRNAEGKLSGSSCSYNIMRFISYGDSSIEAAKAKGKISRVAAVEYEQFAVLGIGYHSFCTIVFGSSNDSNVPDWKADLEKPAAGKKK
ncbi:TRL-like family protein [Leptospira fletcheri]|uniref:TRL-like family protein n=1 Tax=Leptospira fletcheri TaxID=2484981 RepID=A0A4R9GAV7_9LEPT|nr:TRL-like family protein [Leptospira fletcheri]TGK08761.1 TRL-like family protein [Leptospira fletcheri]